MSHGPVQSNYASNDAFRQSPLLVFYEVTQACDLVCQHCRACAQMESHPAELSTDESSQLIEQIAQFPHPPMLVLTGGDPFKRADIFELVEEASWHGLNVSMTASATGLVTFEAIERLQEAGLARLAISLDGASSAMHDEIRGVFGSFDRSVEILQDARRLDMPTQINTVVSRRNYHEIDEMAERFAEFEIVMWTVFFLVPVGRAESDLCLPADAVERVFQRLWYHAQRQPYAIKTTEAPHYRRYVIQHQLPRHRHASDNVAPSMFLTAGVNDGKGVMFVGHTGMIYPSGFLPVMCGMFPSQSVIDVYQRSPIFRSLRDSSRLEGKCGVCEFRQICGGSRARAYNMTGNLFAQEPECAFTPVAMR